MDPSTIYTPITLTEFLDTEDTSLPDPEGYYAGQEEYLYDPDEDCVRDNDYDDAYEPDFQYDQY